LLGSSGSQSANIYDLKDIIVLAEKILLCNLPIWSSWYLKGFLEQPLQFLIQGAPAKMGIKFSLSLLALLASNFKSENFF